MRKSHPFVKDSFWTGLVGKMVHEKVPIDKVCVVFVTPSDVEFQTKYHRNYTKEYYIDDGPQTRSSKIQKKMDIFFLSAKVDVDPEHLLESHIEKRLLPLLTTSSA